MTILSIMAGVADPSDVEAIRNSPLFRSLRKPIPRLKVVGRSATPRDQPASNAALRYIMELTMAGETGRIIAERDRLTADPFYSARPGLLSEQLAANLRGRICLLCLEVLAIGYGDDEAPVCGDCGDAAIINGRADICHGCGALNMIGTTWPTMDTADCSCGGVHEQFLEDGDEHDDGD